MIPILSTLFYTIAILFLLYCVISHNLTTSRVGSYIIGIFGLLLLLFTMFYVPLQELRKYPFFQCIYVFSASSCVILLLTFILFAVVITRAAITKPSPNRDAIIVLGAGLKGDRVSLSLARRLDAAYRYYLENPNAIMIVSGGQGPDELIPEALAMKRYLIDTYQISPKKIRMESTSTRTLENFQFSKQILDQHFNRTYTIVYVTNNFHVYRSGLLAKITELDAQGLGAPSAYYLLPNFYVREYLSLIKFYWQDR